MSISDRYESMELIQSTPTGEIYRARHRVLGRPVLIRTLDTTLLDTAEIADVRDAVVRTAQLVHPNILSVIDAEFGIEPYYVTDNVVASLKSRMTGAPEPVATVARWGLQLLRAIEHAHAHGVVHRGLSPWRVHFDQVGTVMIGDFGLTTVMRDRRTGTIAIEADAAQYLPLAVLRDPAAYNAQADRYGVAALIAHLLSGSVPESSVVDTSHANGFVPPEVASSLGRLLSARPEAVDLSAAVDVFKRWVDALGPGHSTRVFTATSAELRVPEAADKASASRAAAAETAVAEQAAAEKAAAAQAAAEKAAAEKAAAEKADAEKAAAEKAAAEKAAAEKADAEKADAEKADAEKVAASLAAESDDVATDAPAAVATEPPTDDESTVARPRRTGSRRSVASGTAPAAAASEVGEAAPAEAPAGNADVDRAKGKLNQYAALFE